MRPYYLKRVVAGEEETAMSFIDDAKLFLKNSGVDQWQDGYPDKTSIEGDVEAGRGYFLMDENTPVGYMCIDFGGEPAYDGIRGSWLTEEAYGVVHRLAMGSSHKGKGLATVALKLAEDLMIEHGVKSFRIDTDDGNEIMKHLLSKNGFVYCGTIWFANSVKIAYEKIL